jgi:hypothetical protein
VERTTIAGETEVLGENLPQLHFVPPQILHDQVRFRTPDRSGGKPATNRLSYGAANPGYLLFHLDVVVWQNIWHTVSGINISQESIANTVVQSWALQMSQHVPQKR